MSQPFLPGFVAASVLALVACQPGGSPDAATTASVGAEPPSAESSSRQDDSKASEAGGIAAATIGDRTITLDELDDYIKDDLFERESSNREPARLYELRSEAIGHYIEAEVIRQIASEKGVSPEEFLDGEVIAESEIPEEEVAAYFESNKDQMGDATLEQIGPRIRSYLRTQRAADLVAKLTTDSGAVVLLQPPRIQVAAQGPSKGPADAPITIVEFSDFECPYCKRVVPTIHQIAEAYPDQVRIVFRHLPLERIHKRARRVAEAAVCADKQNRFWEFHDLVFENNRALTDADLGKYASDVGMEVAAFEACLADPATQVLVQEDLDAARELGISGTPAFFVNGIPLKGARPFEDFSGIIESELTRAAKTAPPSS